ncbi:MAG: hypothetical protein JOS17DRAFT_76577 [Linnemannia elongata]|nr:MAG: hypothetical protein JOS17DRAFT_76577 [Linnemannia elongata]
MLSSLIVSSDAAYHITFTIWLSFPFFPFTRPFFVLLLFPFPFRSSHSSFFLFLSFLFFSGVHFNNYLHSPSAKSSQVKSRQAGPQDRNSHARIKGIDSHKQHWSYP